MQAFIAPALNAIPIQIKYFSRKIIFFSEILSLCLDM